MRGSILDVYSFSGELPYRIDFFDDEIDSIRVFNVETQLSEKKLDTVSIIPPGGEAEGNDGVSLLEFADASTIVACQSVQWLETRIRAICEETMSDAVAVTGEGDSQALAKRVDGNAFLNRLEKMKQVEFGGAADVASSFKPDATLSFNTSLQTLYHKNFNLIADSFSGFLSEGYTLFILSDTPYQNERLKAIFEDRGDKIPFVAVDHTLHEGFVDHDTKACFFTDHRSSTASINII